MRILKYIANMRKEDKNMYKEERRMFMSIAVINRYGSKICNDVGYFLDNNELEKDNFFCRIKRNYNLINEIKEKAQNKQYKDYISKNIVKNAKIRNGRPTIKGTRLTPNDVAMLCYRTNDISIENILKEYPTLTDERQVAFVMLYYMERKLKNPFIKILCLLGI